MEKVGIPKKRPGLLSGVLGFLGLAFLVLFIRWATFEIFVIPSGSMYPKLYINDYILVSKFDFGIRLPFTQKWISGPFVPNPSSVVVFRSPDDTKYFVKRVIGVPGDEVVVYGDFIVSINGQSVSYQKVLGEEKLKLASEMNQNEQGFDAYFEVVPSQNKASVRRLILTSYDSKSPNELNKEDLVEGFRSFKVPQDYLFFMGDNRHRSYDGRRFGYVPQKNLTGRARFIILSCSSDLSEGRGCDLQSLRSKRLGNRIDF